MKLSKKFKVSIFAGAIALIVAVVSVVNVLALAVYSEPIIYVMGGIQITSGDSSGLDLQYNKTTYTADTIKAAQSALCEEITENGIVLLEHKEGSGFPFADNTEFSVFSHSSVDWVAGGTGSGGGSSDLTVKKAFAAKGLSVNDTLWNFYSGKPARGIGSVDFGDAEDYSINEVPRSALEAEPNLAASYAGTKAMFVLSRTGGEGRDLARSMVQHTAIAADKSKHYLEPDSVELGVIQYLQDSGAFDEIVLVINCNNAVELGWTKNYSKIKTVLHVPGTGMDGLYGLADVLTGKASPSGRLADTYAYDLFSAPATENFDESVFYPGGNRPDATENAQFYYYMVYAEGIYVGYKYFETRYEDAILGKGNASGNAGTYASQSGWNYAEEVQYPFGFGLSTTKFEWSNYSVNWNGKECTVTVDVKNIGDKSGRDVVQIYAQTPYDHAAPGSIEKSSVQLVGFAKTPELAAGKDCTVTVKFSESELKVYDTYGEGTYILDDGTYYITAAVDSHAAVNNILKAKAPEKAGALVPSPAETVAGNADLVDTYVVDEIDPVTYSSADGVEIENRLQHAEWKDKFGAAADFKYLSRGDWQGTYPAPVGELTEYVSLFSNRIDEENTKGYMRKLDITAEEHAAIRSIESHNPTPDSSFTEAPVFKSNETSLEFIDMRGLAFDDAKWDEIVKQISAEEMTAAIMRSGYQNPEIRSIKKPATGHRDGPKGIGYVYPCEVMIAQTWDKDLTARFGSLVGDEAILTKVTAWFAPGANIHRSPFSGRNFEYYSEDAFLSGAMAAVTVRAAAEKGLLTCIKHFAFNDSEAHRGDRNNHIKGKVTVKGDDLFAQSIFAGLGKDTSGVGDWGMTTWMPEQAAREIYLRPFEDAVRKSGEVEQFYYKTVEDENGNKIFEKTVYSVPACNGIMSSFNRIGPTWAGGDYNLITNIVRNEWGFNGYILTDFDNGGYMSTVQQLRAGADFNLNFTGMPEYDGKKFEATESMNSAMYYYSKEAMKRNLYATVNSSLANGLIHGVVSSFFGYHNFIVIGLDVLAAAGIGLLAWRLIKLLRGNKEKAENEKAEQSK